MLKALIWDMDGVLVETEQIYFQVFKDIFKKKKLPFSEEVYNGFMGRTNPDIWREIKEQHGLAEPVEDLIAYHKHEDIHRLQTLRLVSAPGLIDLLENLKRHLVRMAIASSSPMEYIKIIIDSLQISSYFEFFLSAEMVHRGKPEPDIYLEALRRLTLPSKQCVVIEDSANGMKAASRADLFCIGLKHEGNTEKNFQYARHTVESLKELDYSVIDGLLR